MKTAESQTTVRGGAQTSAVSLVIWKVLRKGKTHEVRNTEMLGDRKKSLGSENYFFLLFEFIRLFPFNPPSPHIPFDWFPPKVSRYSQESCFLSIANVQMA